ncbi:MAG: DUF255 domain-containing protein [Methylocella sp.]
MRRIRELALAASLAAAFPAFAAAPFEWAGWNADLFTRATSEKRLVILNLEAVWCHWCHVMDETTYADQKIEALIGAKYIPVRVDQDGNPDLASRYGDWGWPATIIFAPDGTELAKMRGYIEPERMAALLEAFIDDPTPGPSVNAEAAVVPAPSAFLTKSQRSKLVKDFNESYDFEHGGWGNVLHYIDADSMDYDITLAESGDKRAERQARQTLDAALALIDPVWGGVYQYSDKTDWSSPHFEKIISFQAQYLREYSQAFARWHDPRYLGAAKAIKAYLTGFLLGPDGAFYVSQDADLNREIDGHAYYAQDDAARRKLGLPRIDKHLYARENGWAISALAAYYNVTNDEKAVRIAERAAHWVLTNRGIEGGGFRHDAKDRGGPFLGDTLAMGQAFLDLYAATGERAWLNSATAACDYAGAAFKDPAGGFLSTKTSEADVGVFTAPAKQVDDQIAVARFMNLLNRYTGNAPYRGFAVHAMRYAVGASKGLKRPLPGVLLGDLELGREPVHITIVGHKDDKDAAMLFAAARAFPARYERLEWWDTSEGPLTNPDVTYPELDKPAAFACANRTCSLPVFTGADLTAAVDRMARAAR